MMPDLIELSKFLFLPSGYLRHIKTCTNETERIRKKYNYAHILGLPKLPKTSFSVKEIMEMRDKAKE